jgi:hypothetical protein
MNAVRLTKGLPRDIFMYTLGGLIVCAFFAVIVILLTVSMPQANENMLYILLGALVAKFGDVVSYFYGTSKSSSDKNEMIERQLEKTKP